MSYDAPGFRAICRIVLFFFTFQSLQLDELRYTGPPIPLAALLGIADWQEVVDDSEGRDPIPLAALLGIADAHAQDPLLDPTPDADSADPFIVAKAQELGNDPVAIFEFVRDEIGFESYKGSLRGARGALWSKAGNALDQTSLLIALFRASNIPARYAQGMLLHIWPRN